MKNELKPRACEVVDIIPETKNEYTFRLKKDVEVNHGQFFQVSLPKIGEAPISVSDFGNDWMDFTIRRVGKVTNKLFEIEPGDKIFLRGPYGNGWPLDKFMGKNMVVIAGGTGVSPVRSLINKFYTDQNFIKDVHIIIGFRDEENIIFKRDLLNWEKRFNTIYTLDKNKKEGWEVGFVTKHIDKVPFDNFNDNYEVVIVGPPQMMHYAGIECVKNGVSDEKIWVSFERKMSCGIGKCGHCRIDDVYVCLDGPVFNYSKAKKLLD
ncbi:anaerobic sulfite reductase subunit AsrB [Tepidanaerobacter acetatoxydans]|uniref:anaerobic sulfite reductase subunit AsrB n=1 Tax=Tepidanaerobacter acetatoxydans TaxID=499229 RepID=UPI001BD655DE|nr:anaerobic sulfite reductase subunit AsrB [Tepidanaerobacter acetatoxydans]